MGMQDGFFIYPCLPSRLELPFSLRLVQLSLCSIIERPFVFLAFSLSFIRMRSTTLFFGVSQFLAAASATNYALSDTYNGDSSFFNKFTFFTGDDGTGGFAK